MESQLLGDQLLSRELSDRLRRLSDEARGLVIEAFTEGERRGAERVAGELVRYCESLLAELERQHDELTPERAEQVAAMYAGVAPSAAVAAHFGGSADIASRVLGEARRLQARRAGRG